jgi:hypothetical protein
MSRKRRLRRLITNTAILIGTGALGALAVAEGREWSGKRDLLDSQGSQQARWTRENDQHRQIHAGLQPRRFKVCNSRTGPVRIDWLYAAYPEGDKMASFDSARCADWPAPVVGDGKTEFMRLNSAQPGCNWSGDVVFYATSVTLPDGRVLNVGGTWGDKGFKDPDCFTL